MHNGTRKSWYLSQRMAERCEQAREKVCTCKCGGSFHGKKRVSIGGDFSELPINDPHYRPPQDIKTRPKLKKFLRDAALKMQFPQLGDSANEPAYDKAWDAFYEALTIIHDSIRQVDKP
jgi:hypothetical protein